MKKENIIRLLGWLSLLCGVAGGLLGYGFYGGVQEACVGAGLGLIAPPVGVVVAAFLEVG